MKSGFQKREIEEFFTRGIEKFIDPDDFFKKKLERKITGELKEDIIIKLGVDPNKPDIHIGHAVILRKLRILQDWGCRVVFLIGDFTAQIGDPTGKSKTRPEVKSEEIEKNLNTYLDQAKKILRTDKESFSWIKNSDWYTSVTDLNLPPDYKVTLEIKNNKSDLKLDTPPNSFIGKAVVFEKTRRQIKDSETKGKVTVVTLKSFLWILKHLTLSRLIERDMFQERIKKGQELYMHEVIYPALQGIDSQIISEIYGGCDLEIGGTDQLFNMLVGRDIMKFNKKQPQSVLACALLEGLDGKEKMSKSLDNYIGINESAKEMFGKVMSIPDSIIVKYFTLATYAPSSEIKEIEQLLKKKSTNPRDLKLRLAKEIITIYHGEEAADKSEKDFLNVFQKKKIPEDLEQIKVDKNRFLSEILVSHNIIKSKTEFRRLVEDGAVVELTSGQKIKDFNFSVAEDSVFKIGKRRFLKVKVNN